MATNNPALTTLLQELIASSREAIPMPEETVEEVVSTPEDPSMAAQAYGEFEKLPLAQQLALYVAPGTGHALSAYETPMFAGETKEALEEGNIPRVLGMGALTGLSALGTIPGLGVPIRGVKAGIKAATKAIPKQAYTSAKTSRKQIPALFKNKNFDVVEDSVNVDIGGGAFDLGSEYLQKEKRITNMILDPFNRPETYESTLAQLRKTPADSATVPNTLNVIQEPKIREAVIRDAKDLTKNNGKVYFSVYEGNKSGIGKVTTDGYQLNRKLETYIPEIEKIFGKGNVERWGDIIIAEKPLKTKGGSLIQRGSNKYSGGKHKHRVGKVMGNQVYFHKNYINDMPQEVQNLYKKSLKKLPKDFKFKTVMYKEATKTDPNPSIRFDEAPDFNTAREPIPGTTITVKADGTVLDPKNVNQIWHHKWLWVRKDYKGFDVKENYDWSKKWLDKGVEATGKKLNWEQRLKDANLSIEDIPTRWYRGTTNIGESSSPAKWKTGKEGVLGGGGIYVTPDPKSASRFATENIYGDPTTGGFVTPLDVTFKNPLVVSVSKTGQPEIKILENLGVSSKKAEDMVEKAYETKGGFTTEIKNRAIKQGYDGIILKRDGIVQEAISYNPEKNIISAITKKKQGGSIVERNPYTHNMRAI